MKIKFLSTLCFLILFSIISLGQSISGKITDKKNNPIANAYIINKVNYAHTHSDSFGKFEISGVSKGDTLVVSHIKFEKIILILSERHFQKDLRLRMEFRYFEL